MASLVGKSVAKSVAKEIASVIPKMLSDIQAIPKPESSVDSKVDPPPAPSTFTFKQFNSCSPTPFTGEDGATTMLQWFDDIAVTFRQSGCPEHLRTTNATGVFKKRALDWWTTVRNTRGDDAAYALSWADLKQLMRDEFCPPHELQKLEEEFWTLKQVSGNNEAYTARFK